MSAGPRLRGTDGPRGKVPLLHGARRSCSARLSLAMPEKAGQSDSTSWNARGFPAGPRAAVSREELPIGARGDGQDRHGAAGPARRLKRPAHPCGDASAQARRRPAVASCRAAGSDLLGRSAQDQAHVASRPARGMHDVPCGDLHGRAGGKSLDLRPGRSGGTRRQGRNGQLRAKYASRSAGNEHVRFTEGRGGDAPAGSAVLGHSVAEQDLLRTRRRRNPLRLPWIRPPPASIFFRSTGLSAPAGSHAARLAHGGVSGAARAELDRTSNEAMSARWA